MAKFFKTSFELQVILLVKRYLLNFLNLASLSCSEEEGGGRRVFERRRNWWEKRGEEEGVEKGGFNNQHPLVAFSVLPSSSSSSISVLGRGEQPKALFFLFLSFPKSDFLTPPHPKKNPRIWEEIVCCESEKPNILKKRKVPQKKLHGVLLTVPPVGDPLPVPPPLLDLCKVPRERRHRAAEEDGGGGGAGGGGGGHLGHRQGQIHAEDCKKTLC